MTSDILYAYSVYILYFFIMSFVVYPITVCFTIRFNAIYYNCCQTIVVKSNNVLKKEDELNKQYACLNSMMATQEVSKVYEEIQLFCENNYPNRND